MNYYIAAAAFLSGYLMGSISFTRIISRFVAPDEKIKDIEVPVEGTDMSYKVTTFGATAASMRHGPKVGCSIGFADMVKVAVPVLVFRLLFPEDPYIYIAAAAGMLGHNWPVYYKFRGGRGISAYYGGIFVIDWLGALSTMIAGMLFGFFIVRDFFVAYMAGLWFIIPWAWFTTHRYDYLAYTIAANIMYIIAMLPDIKQYVKIRKNIKVTTKMVLETSPMGRGMLKISEWVKGIFRKKQP